MSNPEATASASEFDGRVDYLVDSRMISFTDAMALARDELGIEQPVAAMPDVQNGLASYHPNPRMHDQRKPSTRPTETPYTDMRTDMDAAGNPADNSFAKTIESLEARTPMPTEARLMLDGFAATAAKKQTGTQNWHFDYITAT